MTTTFDRFPSIEIKALQCDRTVVSGEVMQVIIELERVGEDQDYTDIVIAPYYPKPKEESWWVLCADKKSNRLFGNKKVTFKDFSKIDLRFQAPEPGDYELTVYSMCDSYVGSDQVRHISFYSFKTRNFQIKVIPPELVEEPEEAPIEEEPQNQNPEGTEAVREIVQDMVEENK
jgi:pre-mRNA-splicing helicase BRR2